MVQECHVEGGLQSVEPVWWGERQETHLASEAALTTLSSPALPPDNAASRPQPDLLSRQHMLLSCKSLRDKEGMRGLPWWSSGKESPANEGDTR